MSPGNTMADKKDKPLMRSLGEFFGHIIRGVKTDPGGPKRAVVRRQIEEEDRGDMVLRRTTIEEIEIKSGMQEASPEASEEGSDQPPEEPDR
jgi:hypothetical protein